MHSHKNKGESGMHSSLIPCKLSPRPHCSNGCRLSALMTTWPDLEGC